MSKEYIQPNITNEETIKLIKEKIKSNTPFSLTRFGDGEINIMTRRTVEESWLHRVCRLHSYDFKDNKEINQLYLDYGNLLWDVFKNSDVIGIMKEKCDVLRSKQKLSDWSFDYDTLLSKNINYEKLKICEHQIPRHKIMGDPQNMKNILDGNDIHIITMYPNRLKERNLDKILNVNITYTENKQNYCLRNREEILKSFENIKENIVLLAIGLDKDYGIILRDKYGKITLDMGATIDAWSGIYSRNHFKKGNLQEHCFIK